MLQSKWYGSGVTAYHLGTAQAACLDVAGARIGTEKPPPSTAIGRNSSS